MTNPPDEKYLDIDPLRESYLESIIDVPAAKESITAHNTALLCIDVQYLDAAPGYGVFADLENISKAIPCLTNWV